jgi:methyl-accepting chemotaxis protein WspA
MRLKGAIIMGIEPYRNPPNFIERILLRYTFRQKITLITVLISFAIIFVTYLFMSSQFAKIQYSEQELLGNEYQNYIQKFYSELIKYRTAINQSEKPNIASLSERQKLISDNFKQFLIYNHKVQYELGTSEDDFQIQELNNISPEKTYDNWVNLENSSTPLSQRDYNNLIQNLQDLLLYVGDSSYMTYDPEKETSYLMETSIRALPKEQDLISQLLTTAASHRDSSEGFPEKDRFLLTKISLLLSSSVQMTERAINKAIINDSNRNTSTLTHQTSLESLKRYKEAVKNLTSLVTELAQTKDPKSSDNIKPNELEEKLSMLGGLALSANDQLWTTLIGEINRLLEARISSIRATSYTLIGILAFCIGVSALLGYYVMSETNFFFRTVHTAIVNFSGGDLTSRAPVTYDKAFSMMRKVLNDLGDSIESLIEQLHKSGVQLTTTTTQIAAAAKHQEGTVCQQGATVKQILITAGEISSTAKDFAKTMDQVSKSAEQTSHLAASGKEGLNQMETIMHQMVSASKNIASKLAVLNEKANAITSVITTITKVADQTNLLSLNASIEAEKAGEHGKSFAVIAREIRRLADQTANATLDIEKMISEMMSAVSEGVMGVDKFIEEIRTGVSQVSIVSEQLSQIIERVQHQTASYERVNKGVQQQSLGAEQINDSIMQLSDAAQETTKSIRQFHNAIEQLNVATKGMQVSVSRIKK